MNIGIDARLIDERVKFGVNCYQNHLLAALAEADCENEYSLFFQSLTRSAPDLPGPAQANFRKVAIRLPNGFGSDLKEWFFVERLLRHQIQKRHIDVFHALWTSFPTKNYSAKTVVTIHDLTHKFVTSEKKATRTFAPQSVERSLHHADVLLAISENTKCDILKYYSVNPENIKVIYLGFNPSICKLPQEEADRFRNKRALPE